MLTKTAALLLALPLLVGACSSPEALGIQAYNQSNYPSASKYLDTALEAQDQQSTRLLLYAGLTCLALGDAHNAVLHLAAARTRLGDDPESLTLSERGQLMTAWSTLGSMPGEPLVLPDP